VPPPIAFFVRVSPGRTVIAKEELKNFGSPMRPRRTRSTAARLISSKCSRYAIISLTRFRRQASIIRRHSSTVTAIGFSQRTWTPALAARIAYSACRAFGSAI
jgi:hypothetical protein